MVAAADHMIRPQDVFTACMLITGCAENSDVYL